MTYAKVKNLLTEALLLSRELRVKARKGRRDKYWSVALKVHHALDILTGLDMWRLSMKNAQHKKKYYRRNGKWHLRKRRKRVV